MIASSPIVAMKANHQFLSNWLKRPTRTFRSHPGTPRRRFAATKCLRALRTHTYGGDLIGCACCTRFISEGCAADRQTAFPAGRPPPDGWARPAAIDPPAARIGESTLRAGGGALPSAAVSRPSAKPPSLSSSRRRRALPWWWSRPARAGSGGSGHPFSGSCSERGLNQSSSSSSSSSSQRFQLEA
jgi:hypothetical protein